MNLDRFIEAQKNDFNRAYEEIKRGRKESHWIWYIFPQLQGLGYSYYANYYGIESIKEAKEYYNNDYLRNNLIKISEALYNLDDDITNILGYPDDLKVKSSMTLFYKATGNILFKNILDKFYHSKFCETTLKMLEAK